jgi:sugar phosphate isomerase/epimerase
MKIGFALYVDVLLGLEFSPKKLMWEHACTSIRELLNCLKKEGIDNIELKLPAELLADRIRIALQMMKEYSFHYSFHAPGMTDFPGGMDNYIYYLNQLFKISQEFGEPSILVVLHGLSGTVVNRESLVTESKKRLREIVTNVGDSHFKFVLENLRDLNSNGKRRCGTSYQEILDIQNYVGREQLGICWDFGHGYSQAEHGIHERIPPFEFLEQVWHTHIHDYRDNITHLPLGHGIIPYQLYIHKLLETGFDGIYNLELNPSRVKDPENFLKYVTKSIHLLKLILAGIESKNKNFEKTDPDDEV